jgi:hypothetical protein
MSAGQYGMQLLFGGQEGSTALRGGNWCQIFAKDGGGLHDGALWELAP